MATHSSILAWGILRTEEPRGLPSMGLQKSWTQASLLAQTVKRLPAIWEAWVRSLGWEDTLEEGMATPPVFLPGESLWTDEPGGLESMGLQRVGHN